MHLLFVVNLFMLQILRHSVPLFVFYCLFYKYCGTLCLCWYFFVYFTNIFGANAPFFNSADTVCRICFNLPDTVRWILIDWFL